MEQLIGFLLAIVFTILAALGGAGAGNQVAQPQPALKPAQTRVVATPKPAPKPVAKPAPKPVARRAVSQQELQAATNRYRRAHGLSTLKVEPRLNNLAQDWANTLSANGAFYHRPKFADSYPRGWKGASENIAGVGADATADDFIRTWAKSPGHRANMMDPHATHFGVGVAMTRDGRQIAVQNFARY